MSKSRIGKPTWNKGKKCPQISRAKMGHSQSNTGRTWFKKGQPPESYPQWKGGKYKTPQGYIYAHQPNHPLCTKDGYVREHRLIMEKYIGRYLTQIEKVHHINEIKDDNRIENLMLLANLSEHTKLHKKNHLIKSI
jgi:hypothetical protein